MVIPKQESIYKGSLILPTFIPLFEASDKYLPVLLLRVPCESSNDPVIIVKVDHGLRLSEARGITHKQ